MSRVPVQPRWLRSDQVGMTNFGAKWLPVIVASYLVMEPRYHRSHPCATLVFGLDCERVHVVVARISTVALHLAELNPMP